MIIWSYAKIEEKFSNKYTYFPRIMLPFTYKWRAWTASGRKWETNTNPEGIQKKNFSSQRYMKFSEWDNRYFPWTHCSWDPRRKGGGCVWKLPQLKGERRKVIPCFVLLVTADEVLTFLLLETVLFSLFLSLQTIRYPECKETR